MLKYILLRLKSGVETLKPDLQLLVLSQQWALGRAHQSRGTSCHHGILLSLMIIIMMVIVMTTMMMMMMGQWS